MSEVTMKDKVVQQASRIATMSQQINFLLRALYKSNPSHEVFLKNTNLAMTVKAAVETEDKNEEKSNNSEK